MSEALLANISGEASVSDQAQPRRNSLSDPAERLESNDGRERADCADLQRHLDSCDGGLPTWADGRSLPPPPGSVSRATSWCDARQRLDTPELEEARAMRQPGGFRRSHLNRTAEAAGVPRSEQPANYNKPLVEFLRTNHDFMSRLYSFAADDCLSQVDMGSFAIQQGSGLQSPQPLKLGTTGTLFALFKANIGLVVLMMPAGWKSGGWLMSTIMCPLVTAISVLCGLRLITVRSQRSGTYGDLMFAAFGNYGRVAINSSVVLVLLGTICGYMNTISQLLRAAIFHDIADQLMIWAVAFLLIVPGLLRKMASLDYLNLIGCTFVLSGLIIIVLYETLTLANHGAKWDSIVAVNGNGFFVFLGLACSAQEGAACLVPIYDATANPAQFKYLYMSVMGVIATLLSAVGLLGYLAFGSEVDAIVLVNFTPGTVVSVIQVAYSIGAFCTMPLFLLPSLMLLEVNIWKPMSVPPLRRKCAKNIFRIGIIVLLALGSIYGAAQLQNFFSILGAVCGIPMCFVFPCMVHLKLIDGLTFWDKLMDQVMIGAGLLLTVIITVVNAQSWGQN